MPNDNISDNNISERESEAEDLDSNNESDEQLERAPVPRTVPNSAQQLLGNEIVERARRAPEKLRANLTGTVLLKLSPPGSSYLFDWSGDNPSCVASDRSDADCTIIISEENLMRIANGDLNPQIAILSDKVKVAGKMSLAVYFFNLVVP